MFLSPFSTISFIKISSLKATSIFLLILLIKSNLLRIKGGLIGALFALILFSGILVSTGITLGSLFYAYKLRTKNNNSIDSEQNIEAINI